MPDTNEGRKIMIHSVIKQFEKQLQFAMNQYLQNKKELKNGNGEKFYIGSTGCSGLYVSLRGDYQKNILLAYLNTPTNAQPCISGYVNLLLQKRGDNHFAKDRYFFHICAKNYSVSTNNKTVNIKGVDFFCKQGYRYS